MTTAKQLAKALSRARSRAAFATDEHTTYGDTTRMGFGANVARDAHAAWSRQSACPIRAVLAADFFAILTDLRAVMAATAD